MADQGSNRSHSRPRQRGPAQSQNPAEIARRELIAWCQAHQLPIPSEHQSRQSNGR